MATVVAFSRNSLVDSRLQPSSQYSFVIAQEITPAARDVFLDSADALIESDGAREALATALAALSGIKTCQRSLLTGAEKNTTVIVTSRSGFRTKGRSKRGKWWKVILIER